MFNRPSLPLLFGATAFTVPSSLAHQGSGGAARSGWWVPTTEAEWDGLLTDSQHGMRELGYIEGRTVETKYVYVDGPFDRLSGLADKLLEHKVDLIVTASTPASFAAK